MVDAPYSGTAVRNAHFSSRPPAPGLNKDHFTPDPEPDPFNPVPTPPVHPYTDSILTVTEELGPQSNYPTLATQPFHHTYDGQPSVPSGVSYNSAQQAMQERMMVDHSDSNYVPDENRRYRHATQGQNNQYVVGRMPQNAGVDPGPNLQYLVNGKNSYDHTNEPNEVYTGDAANVGRYRLGVLTQIFGLYDNPLGKFGQDAQLHAYTGQVAQVPQAKPQMTDTAPYTRNSTGTARWAPATFAQIPSTFALPSETSLTDATVANEYGDTSGGSEFTDG
jgi:hypothetical protein